MHFDAQNLKSLPPQPTFHTLFRMQNTESELKWQTCQTLCIKVHQNATAQKGCSSGKGLNQQIKSLVRL